MAKESVVKRRMKALRQKKKEKLETRNLLKSAATGASQSADREGGVRESVGDVGGVRESVGDVSSVCDASIPSSSFSEQISIPSTSTNEVVTSTPLKGKGKAVFRLELIQKARDERMDDEDLSELALEEKEGVAQKGKETEKSGVVMLSPERFSELFESHCDCYVGHTVQCTSDGFDDHVKITCALCETEFESAPETLIDSEKASVSCRNIGLVYHSIIEGYGLTGMNRLLGILGKCTVGGYKYYRYLDFLTEKMNGFFEEKQSEIHNTVRNYYSNNTDRVCDENGYLNIDVSYDGTWQKRGHTSLVSMGFIIEVNTGLVIDYDILCKHCPKCVNLHRKLEKKEITEAQYTERMNSHDCSINFQGASGGMEKALAITLFGRSRNYNLQYVNFIGDGDSSAFNGVIEMNEGQGPYDGTKITKLECVNHYQKRLGFRLRKLVEQGKDDFECKTGRMIRKSQFGGLHKLSGTNIDLLTDYFGRAIRRNKGKTTVDMRRGIMASYYHVFEGIHGACPLAKDSYCKYQREVAMGKPKAAIVPKPSSLIIKLNDAGKEKVKALYRSLVNEDNLNKLLPGYTQNANESLHSKVWRRAGKCKLLGVQRLHFISKDVILTHCFGYENGSVLKSLQLGSSGLDKSLALSERKRLSRSRNVSVKKKKKKTGKVKDYVPGGF